MLIHDRDEAIVMVPRQQMHEFMHYNDGLHQTIDWYFSTKNRAEVQATLDRRLTER
jgi:hypothetical protein